MRSLIILSALSIFACLFWTSCSDNTKELIKSCKGKDANACYKVAVKSMKKGDEKTAMKYGEKACKFKLEKACKKMADIWLKRGKKYKAKKYYSLGCKAGDDLACILAKSK